MPIRKPRFITNLQSYLQHFGRGILLLIGVLAIIALVVATFIYGDQRREEAEGINTEEVATTESETANGTTTETGDDEAANQTQETNDDGAATANETAPATGGDDEERPAEIANTGPEDAAAPLAILMGWLFYIHRRSAARVRQAQTRA